MSGYVFVVLVLLLKSKLIAPQGPRLQRWFG
jgi:hypothetical protein